MGWDQLRAGIELPFDPSITVPELHEVEMTIPTAAPVVDIERAAADAVVATLAEDVTPGITVAARAGSRGLPGRAALLRGPIPGLRTLGAEPLVVPAMGSHG